VHQIQKGFCRENKGLKFQSDFELPIRQYVQEAAGDENSFNEIVPLFD
jgi:hypothetical protein